MSEQTPIDHADQLWCTLERSYPFLRDLNHDIQEKRKQLQRKEVVISAFGRHNCGKSTLLNALLRNCLLPTNVDNETCIEIRIQHDSRVHPGLCTENCRGNDCPRLEQEISTTERRIVAIGADAVEEKLRDENENCRQTGIVTEDGRRIFVIFAFVPMLKEAPVGWTLTLVDTPGFGEANVDDIMRHTDMLFNTSTAYLYLMESTNMEDKVDSENIKLLFEHDKDIFKDGRLIIALNKYDIRLSQESRHRNRRRTTQKNEPVSATNSLKILHQNTLSFIAKTVECQSMVKVEIVPMSAMWGEIAMWLRAYPNDEQKLEEARHHIRSCPDSQPQGEGGADMMPQDMATTLEGMSGVLNLEESLKEMIKKCICIWRTSLTNAYTCYLKDAASALEKHQRLLQNERRRVAEGIAQLESYDAKKKQLTGLAYYEGGEKPEIATRLEKEYMENDIEPAKDFLHRRIEEKVQHLMSVMKGNVCSKKFSPRDFEEQVKKFIQEEAGKVLNEEQLYLKLEGVAREFTVALEEMKELDREIEQRARNILPEEWSPHNDDLDRERASGKDKGFLNATVLRNRELTLNDLHQRAKAPEIHLGFLQRIWSIFRNIFGVKPHYKEWTEEMDKTLGDLKLELIASVDSYLTDTLQGWVVEIVSDEYRNRVKSRCEALLGTFEPAIREARSKLEEDKEKCATDSDMASLEADITTLQEAIARLEEM